jgi:hypothetical protein
VERGEQHRQVMTDDYCHHGWIGKQLSLFVISEHSNGKAVISMGM